MEKHLPSTYYKARTRVIPIDWLVSEKLSNCSAGTLAKTRRGYVLVFGGSGKGIFLEDNWKAHSLAGATGPAVSVSQLEIEVDPASVFEMSGNGAQLGNVVMQGKHAYLCALNDGGWGDQEFIEINGSSPAFTEDGTGHGFHRWQLIRREGAHKEVLATIENQDIKAAF